ncbi:MAG: sensor domain-containing protein [Dehalococcoidales bacterium]|nr:sensor domain-containing protein [Dehalococcoidales bacterium]
MINNIDQYLSLLKKELSGCDRATIQDALSATEEHLTTAFDNLVSEGELSSSEAMEQTIQEYGMPEEVAKAYRENEYRVTPVLARTEYREEPEQAKPVDTRPFLLRFFGIFADSRAWGSLLYLLFSLATGIIYFTWTVTGLSLSLGMLILIIGLPLAALFILSVRGIGLVEGLLVEALLGIRMPRRQTYYSARPGWWLRFKQVITDKQTWFSLIYMILKLPLGIFYFVLLVVLVSVSLYLVALPVLQLGFDLPIAYANGVLYYLTGWMLPVAVIIGILLLTLTMHLARYLGMLQGSMAKAMLVKFYN